MNGIEGIKNKAVDYVIKDIEHKVAKAIIANDTSIVIKEYLVNLPEVKKQLKEAGFILTDKPFKILSDPFGNVDDTTIKCVEISW
jgi:hypothetical protein